MLSTMAGHQLPVLSLLVPAYMVKCMCSWKRTLAVWPALLVSGGSFAVFQYVFATMHDRFPGVVLFPMTDIGGGIFSLVVTAIFLQFWKPKDEWHFTTPTEPSFSGAAGLHAITAQAPYAAITEQPPTPISSVQLNASDPHAAEAMALMGGASKQAADDESKPLTMGNVTLAWMPFILMSVLLMLTGIVRQKEGHGPIPIGATGIQTNYMIPVPTLHNEALRAEILRPVGKEKEAESALFNFAWLTAPGTAVFLAALLSMALFRMSPMQIGVVMRRTIVQMKIPIPTIAFMLGLSYVTRYAGMDATLGVAFANTGFLYPFFAAILGWLGVFLTGTDAGSNALFGSLQRITASQIFPDILPTGAGQNQAQAQVHNITANTTVEVKGKMIDAQSICVATAATHQLGKEADIFKAVIWHSIILASIVGLMTLMQAYIYPFTLMVPSP